MCGEFYAPYIRLIRNKDSGLSRFNIITQKKMLSKNNIPEVCGKGHGNLS